MAHLQVSELAYSAPGGQTLFFDVSFGLSPGDHAGLIGDNGTGKSTILRILAGELQADDGDVTVGGSVLYMAQDVGFQDPAQSIRGMLLTVAPARTRTAGLELLAAEQALESDNEDSGMRLAAAIAEWGEHGGYELEQRWDAALHRSMSASLTDVGDRGASQLSGGERKRILLELMFSSDADVLLLDEPDNYLDIPGKRWLEEKLGESPKTILLVSHDRVLLSRSVNKLVTLEGSGCWIHHGSFSTYAEARNKRQEKLGDELKRWEDEERRLFRHYKIMKQRAALNFKNAPKANAAESRWQRFVANGPPPPPAPEQKVNMRLRGGDSARRAVRMERLAIPGLVLPFTEEVHLNEHVGLIGPNGSGKSHLLRLLAGEPVPHKGDLKIGNRIRTGLFSQVGERPDFSGREVLDIVHSQVGEEQRAMQLLARYGLQRTVRQKFETLSGGQKARLEVLWLEIKGSNLLLLDEPTDHLDIDSSQALESALDSVVGTVIAVSHDRAFLSRLDRYLILLHSGEVFAPTDLEGALRALEGPDDSHRSANLGKRLTVSAA